MQRNKRKRKALQKTLCSTVITVFVEGQLAPHRNTDPTWTTGMYYTSPALSVHPDPSLHLLCRMGPGATFDQDGRGGPMRGLPPPSTPPPQGPCPAQTEDSVIFALIVSPCSWRCHVPHASEQKPDWMLSLKQCIAKSYAGLTCNCVCATANKKAMSQHVFLFDKTSKVYFILFYLWIYAYTCDFIVCVEEKSFYVVFKVAFVPF